MAEAKDALPAAQPQAVALPDDEVLYELADLFRVFGDSTRIKILYALHDNELCVRFRRDGKTVYYALDDDHVRSILSLGMEHIEESLKGRYYL